jgi:hypothetical protein
MVRFGADWAYEESWVPAYIHSGQGIAWDRSDRGVIYGIIRAMSRGQAGGGNNKVTVFRLEDSSGK